MSHVEWDGRMFTIRSPQALPSIRVKLKPIIKLHEDIRGIRTPHSIRNDVTLEAFTDTCAQTCVCGEEILSILHLQEIYLIPTSHKIAGVTGKYIDILGVILAEIEYNELSSHTVIYVGKGIRGFFLSPKVQTDIGILPNG